MTNYNDYKVADMAPIMKCYQAFKHDAIRINGIRFSHMFYFIYACKTVNCTVNGKDANAFKPNLNDNYYQANLTDEGGCVISYDLENFLVLLPNRTWIHDGEWIKADQLSNYEFQD